MKPCQILKTYFGLHEGQSPSQFMKEVRELNESAKMELVSLAAEELNVRIEEYQQVERFESTFESNVKTAVDV